jgi:hypothetical protein
MNIGNLLLMAALAVSCLSLIFLARSAAGNRSAS